MHYYRAACLLFAATACDNGITKPDTGAVEFSVSATGASEDLDTDGYVLVLDETQVLKLPVSGSMTWVNILAGNHETRLDGLAANCSVTGQSQRPVTVVANEISVVSFAVFCAPNVGTVRLTIATSGPIPQVAPFASYFPGVGYVTLPSNGTVTIPGVRVGQLSLGLGAIPFACAPDPPGSPKIDVQFNRTVEVAVNIRCVSGGSLRVITSTTGPNQDWNGYGVNLELTSIKSQTVMVPTSGTVVVDRLPPGEYVLTFWGVVYNCDLLIPRRTVTIAEGDEVSVTIDVVCEQAREIAFAVGKTGFENIFAIGTDTEAKRSLITAIGSNTDPAWSPDGSRIAFTGTRNGSRGVYVASSTGENPTLLTSGASANYRPAWSPDGSRIAFVSERDGNAEIYSMNADGSNPVRLTSNTVDDGEPDWSPDGSAIVFRSSSDGRGGIFVMNKDGSGIRRLTDAIDRQPSWSPDGSRIAFSRLISATVRDIFVINADGTNAARFTSNLREASDPDWSSDGQRIALSSTVCDEDYYYGPVSCYDVIMTRRIDAPSAIVAKQFTEGSNPAWRP